MDVWSRRIVGWEVHDDELAERAAMLIHRICAECGVDPNGLVLSRTFLEIPQRDVNLCESLPTS